jgi:hypothetical protein
MLLYVFRAWYLVKHKENFTSLYPDWILGVGLCITTATIPVHHTAENTAFPLNLHNITKLTSQRGSFLLMTDHSSLWMALQSRDDRGAFWTPGVEWNGVMEKPWLAYSVTVMVYFTVESLYSSKEPEKNHEPHSSGWPIIPVDVQIGYCLHNMYKSTEVPLH